MLYLALIPMLGGLGGLTVVSPALDSLGMTFGYSWIALFYTLILVLAVTDGQGLMVRALRQRWLGALGLISYGVYLIHMPMLGLFHVLLLHQAPKIMNLTDVGVTVLALVATLTLAALSWKFFEQPLVARGHTLRYSTDRDAPILQTNSVREA